MWNSALCKNIILQVGFGTGRLKVIGGKGLRHKFLMPHLGDDDEHAYIFPGMGIRTRLTFGWFMVTVICGEKPELCSEMQGGAEGSTQMFLEEGME